MTNRKITNLLDLSNINNKKIFQKCVKMLSALSSKLYDCYRIRYEALNLTSLEVESLIKINSRLQDIQSKIQTKVNELQEEMDKKLSVTPNMFDYEIEIQFLFILGKDDKDFDEDDDNIIAEHHLYVTKTHSKTIFLESGYTIPGQPLSHPLNKINQCELFHLLYDHIEYMKLKDIIRIGSVWIDIEVYHQFEFELS